MIKVAFNLQPEQQASGIFLALRNETHGAAG
jgi:hypothetical protein